MRISNPLLPADDLAIEGAGGEASRLNLPAVRAVAIALGALLLGYMFLGRGFAHLGFPPVYVGEIVLAIGIAATGYALWRNGVRAAPTRIVWLLLGLMALGAARTIPYLGTYGLDALRDATLWGYAAFALMVYVIADRGLALMALRAYGWVVPFLAVWLPISWNLFAAASADIDPNRPGSFIPLVFFKGGDMAVHVVGSIALLVLGAGAFRSVRGFAFRTLVSLPLIWTAFVAGASNRGALITAAAGVGLLVILAPRSRNWIPILAAVVMLVFGMLGADAIQGLVPASPSPTVTQGPVAVKSQDTPGPASTAGAATVPPTSTGELSATAPPRGGYPLTIVNPGFESGAINAGKVEGWTVGGVTASIVDGDAHQGTRSAVLPNTRAAYEATLKSSAFAFTAGDDIQVSLWTRAIDGRPKVEIYVNWLDVSGQRISSDYLGGLATDGVREWQLCSGVLASPAGTAQAQVMLYEARGHASLGIDDVNVREGDFIVEPPPPKGRPATIDQIIENILSVFSPSSDRNLEGTKQFRLAWWGKIVDYTIFGEDFWTGKGFGVNLADADGFQSTADHSLRAPHNSHMTMLARTGVPGFLLWVLLQGAFIIGMVRSLRGFRRTGDTRMVALAAWLLVYWAAMMIDTSFDPYLEGPQGGIWFWCVFGLGLAVMRLTPRRPAS